MTLSRASRRRLQWATSAICVLLVAGLGFVWYFMHTVYEREGEDLDRKAVPNVVRTAFEEKFPGAEDVEWELDEGLYEAEFEWQDYEEVEATFAPDGAWSNTDYLVSLEQIPAKAREYLEAQDGYEVGDVERVEAPGSPVTYDAELISRLRKWDIDFDGEGNVIDEERDGPILEGTAD